MNFIELIAQNLKNIKCFENFTTENLANNIIIVSDINKGDYALPCFSMAKLLAEPPNELAVKIAKSLSEKILDAGDKADESEFSKAFIKVEAVNGYVNFYLNRTNFNKQIYYKLTNNPTNFFTDNLGNGKTIIIDFASVNLAKHYHIGHLRNTLIGSALSNIYEAMGFKVIKWNYFGDFGTPFGYNIALMKRENFDINNATVDQLQSMYARSTELAANGDEELIEQGRLWFKKISDGDEEALRLYNKIKEITLRETTSLLKRLNINFDVERGEYYYSKYQPQYINLLKEKNLLVKSEGAQIIDLSNYDLGIALILSSRGTGQYLTRDIAAAYERYKEFNFDKMIYITGSEQNLNFKQLFKILELTGAEFVSKLKHLAHGRYRLESGKLSSRFGAKALMKDILDAAQEKAKEILLEKNRQNLSTDELNQLASKIGIGAVVFNTLSLNIAKDVVFNIEKSLAFDGETGPYLQYTYARICSVLEKADLDLSLIDKSGEDSYVPTTEEFAIFKLAASFKDTLLSILDKNEPALLSRLLIDVAKNFNKFYNENKIIVDDMSIKTNRIKTLIITKQILETGLTLLGLSLIQKM